VPTTSRATGVLRRPAWDWEGGCLHSQRSLQLSWGIVSEAESGLPYIGFFQSGLSTIETRYRKTPRHSHQTL